MERIIPDFMNGVSVAAVICLQWGDTGKGKIVAYFSDWADVIVRGTGTNNAGHTFYHEGKKVITHFIPSGIQYDNQGKITILGSGMGIAQDGFLKEMETLKEAGMTFNNMMISQDANVIMPYHKLRDAGDASMKKGEIGTTGKGTGPVYSDFISRKGIMFRDLLNKELFAQKVKKIYGKLYSDLDLNVDEIIAEQLELFEKIKPFVKNTKSYIEKALDEKKNILIEGAQGTLLSIEHGSYPFVTSSDSTIRGTARGCDIPINKVDLVFGLVKFPVMTRVGNGPFPTEYGNNRSEEYCAEGSGYKNVKDVEESTFDGVSIVEMMNSEDEFRKGIGLRRAMDEYGATTGRPRRIGRADAVAARHAVKANSTGPKIILVSTKCDCVRGMDEIEIGVKYIYNHDEPFNIPGSTLTKGSPVTEFTTNSDLLYRFKTEHESFEGFKEDVTRTRKYEELPIQLRKVHERFEELAGAPFGLISVGPKTEQLVIRDLN